MKIGIGSCEARTRLPALLPLLHTHCPTPFARRGGVVRQVLERTDAGGRLESDALKKNG